MNDANDDTTTTNFDETRIVIVAAGYLVTFATGYLVFHARPFVGALAAAAAIVLSRMLEGALLVRRRGVMTNSE